jgi:uncharacterized protein
MFFFTTDYLLFMVPATLLVMLAQFWVNSTYKRWSQVRNTRGITGAQAAQQLIQSGGLRQVTLEGTRQHLGDHYDPRTRVLRLSPAVAQTPSVAALAIAAHEVGHAEQHRQGYFPLRLRSAIVPMANLGSNLGYILILAGLLLRLANVAWLGVLVFSAGVAFALITLPVELNASARARALLTQTGLVTTHEERRGVNAVLTAAAFTYIAALAAALLQLLYWASLAAGMGRRR